MCAILASDSFTLATKMSLVQNDSSLLWCLLDRISETCGKRATCAKLKQRLREALPSQHLLDDIDIAKLILKTPAIKAGSIASGGLGCPENLVLTIKEIARFFCNGHDLDMASPHEFMSSVKGSELTKIKGISVTIMLRTLIHYHGYADVLPHDPRVVKYASQRVGESTVNTGNANTTKGRDAINAATEHWSPYRSLAVKLLNLIEK
jgi:3-methyladenine DNA glycosylase/8-oxoguanine DNA glycosylase